MSEKKIFIEIIYFQDILSIYRQRCCKIWMSSTSCEFSVQHKHQNASTVESLHDIADSSKTAAAFFDGNSRIGCGKFLLSHIFTHLTVDLTRIQVDLGLILVFFVGTLGIPGRYSTVVFRKCYNKLHVLCNFLFFSASILVFLCK